jgi:hypothetical protein
MKLYRISIFLCLVAGSVTTALGQYGLYGSPDTINMSPQTSYVAPYGYYETASSTNAASSGYVPQQPVQSYQAQTVPTYQTQPVQSSPTQPVQPYPTQPAQTYVNQQMQPVLTRPVATYGQAGSQYRTPTSSQPMYYTAAADQSGATQTIATPQAMPVPQMAPTGQMPAAQPVAPEISPTPGIQQSPGVMSQMLAEQGQGANQYAGGNGNYVASDNQCGVYRPDINRFDQSACGACNYGCAEPCLWYASISALAMTRDRPNKVYITYETGNLPHNDYPVDELSWGWGGEVRFGRRFCCGCNPGYWALEASYWTLDPFEGYVSHTNPNPPYYTVGTPLRVSDIQFNGASGVGWFDNAAEHRLWRTDEVHNVEANLVRGQWSYGNDSRWDLGWSLGVRYFRFEEYWCFGTTRAYDAIHHEWGDNGGLYDAYLSDRITNNLLGPQIGFELGYNISANLRFYLAPKFGIYNNHITNYFQAYLGDGTVATTGTSGVPGTYPVSSSTDVVSFLTQIDVGLDWRFARQWSLMGGYRVVAVSGIGLADAQIPFYIVDIPAIAEIDRNGDLMLHGAYITLAYNF